MKRLMLPLLFLVILSVPIAVAGQEKSGWRKTEDHWTRKNSITATVSSFGFTNYNGLGFAQFNLEYDRVLPFNLSVSAVGIYSSCELGGFSTDVYTLYENFWFAGVKANYNLPVVRNWLYLRMGIGGGVGYHNILNREFGMCKDENCGWQGALPPLENKVKGHMIIDIYWVLRAARWLELRFAPLLISPSQVVFGSKINTPYNDRTYACFNAFGTIGITVRF